MIACKFLLPGAGVMQAQLSSSAYRALGRMDFQQNGVNMARGVELHSPSAAAVDARNGQTQISIADTGNSRVLAWPNAHTYQIGNAPTLVPGRPGTQFSNSQAIGQKEFSGLTGLAVVVINGTPTNTVAVR